MHYMGELDAIEEIEVCHSRPDDAGHSKYVEVKVNGRTVRAHYRWNVVDAVEYADSLYDMCGGEGSGVCYRLSSSVCGDLDSIEN